MFRPALALAALFAIGASPPPADGARPAITGISHLAVYTRDPAASEQFYLHDLGARRAADPEDAGAVRYYLSPTQWVEVLPAPAGLGPSVMAHVAYTTQNAPALRAYLAAHGIAGLSPVHEAAGERWFATHDPEGNEVRFVQPAPGVAGAGAAAIGTHIIHVGYMVHDRAREDGFYRAVLGFRPYWYGAMDGKSVDWVSQQTPDGHDWLEYMLVGPGSTVPESKVDANELGVLNHLSIGVPNMEAAITRLINEQRQSPRHDGPQMGLDGKWQGNLYDPDGTRVELMEFKPVTKPCCSGFTADSPSS